MHGCRVQLGNLPPRVRTPLPGRAARRFVDALARTECPALTTRRRRRAERTGAAHDPIVWRAARGANVVDVDGNVYVDLTAGFGAAAVGHAHPAVVEAVQRQAGRLVHALGDVHPSDVKVRLLLRLARLAPFPDARVILGLSGADAMEAALKTAHLATGRAGVLAFVGGYHGLSHGPLALCGYSDRFRQPFAAALRSEVRFAPFPRAGRDDAERALSAVRDAWGDASIGAVVVEPIQGRGGVVIPPRGFLAGLARLARERGALLVSDEVLTGLGRTGARWRMQAEGVVPDLVCVGKALGGGLPVSATLGPSSVMAAWGDPSAEAIHTGTFFGHPLGCAAALASLEVIAAERLAERAARVGSAWLERLHVALADVPFVREVRGAGLLVGIELDDGVRTLTVVRRLLERGYLTLAAGMRAEVLQLCPPLDIDEALLDGFVEVLREVLLA
ncbi:MAG: aspartate aminotransferase family protein [Myxococcales bacterium]|nr:aspartate aminotransferase family protein [Myxococcales bacterium]